MSRLSRIEWVRGALVVIALAAAVGCGPKRKPALAAPPPESAETAGGTTPTERLGEGPDVQAVEGGEGLSASDLSDTSSLTSTGEGGPLADIRFEYDSAAITPEARATLDRHVVWLQSHRDVSVTIEGHCDERGTVEYNLALGEERARAARDYLASLGVASERLRTVSFGKERPIDSSQSEAGHAKNRRAHFAVAR